jgi:YidC/Oxa1 family membrane protein insertase
MNQELIAFNKQHKLFPPIMGCLPMFLTLPVFIGLFTALRIAFELRHQPFLFFIKDLSEPDGLIPLPPFTLPLFGVIRGINVLPFLMVGLWLFLQRGMPLPTDPQQRQMMKMMKWMPILIGFTFYNYASALMVYMICSSLFGIIEQKVTKARLGSLAPGTMPTV